ncbi:MAG: hypothetical protein QOE70_4635 [Chthoniobacter sp.]|jgi:t-SNARE complex subunit (syntaxin)|nr:hypothetical protein [Chthoniobacter sp.]
MSHVQEIESAIQNLNQGELEQLISWMEDYLEDQMEFTDEFKAKLARAQEDIAAGRVRIRQPCA